MARFAKAARIEVAFGNLRASIDELEQALGLGDPDGDKGQDESPGPMHATAGGHPLGFGQRFKGPFKRLREKLVAEAVADGIPEAEAVETVGALGDGRLLELLLKYGPAIFEMFMKLFGK